MKTESKEMSDLPDIIMEGDEEDVDGDVGEIAATERACRAAEENDREGGDDNEREDGVDEARRGEASRPASGGATPTRTSASAAGSPPSGAPSTSMSASTRTSATTASSAPSPRPGRSTIWDHFEKIIDDPGMALWPYSTVPCPCHGKS